MVVDAAFADITAGPLTSTAADFGTWLPKVGSPIVASSEGGIGGRTSDKPPIVINPSPVVCEWRGGAVANLSCGKCSFGYVRNATGGCVRPAFGASAAVWTSLERAQLGNDELQRGKLRLGSRLRLPAPSLSADKKAGFVGYAAFDYGAISYELDFNQDVDLGCGTTYTNDSSADPPIYLSDTSWDNVRSAFSYVDRPQYLRIKVTTAGSFRFSSCDSLYTVALGLYNRSTTQVEWPYHPSASDFVSYDGLSRGESAFFGLFGFDLPTGSPMLWGSGCELSQSVNRTIELDPGEYVVSVRSAAYAIDGGGIYYVGMECLEGAEAEAPRDSGDPGGIAVDAETGAISGAPERTGTNITMRLLARDALGKRAEVARWAFDVVDPKFDTISGWDKTTLDTNRRVTDKYHFDELHSIDGPADPREIFEYPADDKIDSIVYLFRVTRVEDSGNGTTGFDEWGNPNTNCSSVSALTEIVTGAGAFKAPCTGWHRATLTARDGGGAEAIVNEWDFEARPRDTDVDRYGPNGRICAHGTQVDTVPMDTSFTCDCNDTRFEGENCDRPLSQSFNSADDNTAAIIGGVLGGVLLVVLAALVGLRVQVYVLKNRPVDVGAMQRGVIYSLGLSTAKNIGPLEFGVTLTLAKAVDVVAGQFRSDLVAALRKAVPRLSTNLTTATVTNVAASAGSTAAGSNGATPAAHASQQVLVVISRKQLRRGVAESTVDTLVRLAARGELRVGANAVDDVRIAIPRVVPREVSRQALTSVKLLGEGEHGAVFQYQVHEKSKGGLPFPVAAKTLKATAETPTTPSTMASGREALLKEAALMALFDHRNVVALVGVCTVPRDVPALVLMVLCEHGTLQEHLEIASSIDVSAESHASSTSGHRLSVSERLTLCAEVLQGLDYLSSLRIVHRDIAARNVLLDSTGTCKISDFGMSMSLHVNDEQKEYQHYIRVKEALAIRWAAIEVLNDHRFSKASDVWAVGVLCWEVFADGRLPYGDKFSDLIDIQLHVKAGGKLGSPSSDCPAEVFNELMLPCWQADLRSRPSARVLYDVAVKHGAHEDDVAVEERKALTVDRRATRPTNAAADGDRSLLGVSVEHLSSTCVPAVLRAIDAIRTDVGRKHQQSIDDLPAPADASIWLAVESFGKPFSARTVCPRDGKMGSAYVDVASIQTSIRHATAFLSYAWGYKLVEVVATLVEWCSGEGDVGGANTWIWMDCFTLNQHRIDLGNAATPETLQAVFGGRVTGIGRMLVMLDTWDKPGYVKRVWCLFELYTAIKNKEAVDIDVVLSPQQAQSFRDRINRDGTDARAIDGALKDIKSEQAEATVHADLVAIQALIQKTAGGHATINAEVRGYLRRWFVSQGGINPARRNTIKPNRSSIDEGDPGASASRRQSVSPLRQLAVPLEPSQSGPALALVSTDV